ncbi:MAG: beta-N-acetylhexosaminidase [Hyphomicrobiales bacterium]|nr:MAG: beta-N-acetylhexosaminidase [Hyphomicrobiales bacterium]
MRIKALIAGCTGHRLTSDEKQFFRDAQPWGFIVFARNIDNPDQLRELCNEMRDCVGRGNAPILVDQEGGRVRRMRPPHWRDYYSGEKLGDLYRKDQATGLRAAWLQSRLMAADMIDVGINVNCLPVLDVPVAGAHDVIGDRAYGTDVETIAAMGRAASEGLLAGGVLPVIKHIPGHGRAGADSHKDLPVVDSDLATLERTDFAPFKALNDMPLAMTAHVVYSKLDGDAPATTSSMIINDIIRGFIGFDGLIMSDDLSMHALSGDFSDRTQRAFAAGCDCVLHCNGIMAEVAEIAAHCPELSGKALARTKAADKLLGEIEECDIEALHAEYETMFAALV